MEKIILCKKCRTKLGCFEFNKNLKFDIRCKKCKHQNVGIIIEHNKEKSVKQLKK